MLKKCYKNGKTILNKLNAGQKRFQWSRGSVPPLITKVCGFKAMRIIQGEKNSQHAFLRRGCKAVGPMSQICGT
jgi:hypothetical protein